MPTVRFSPARQVIYSADLQSVKAGAQAFGKTAVQTGAEPRSSGWFAVENPVLILVLAWCLFGAYAGESRFC